MSNKSNYNKTDFVKFAMSTLDHISSDKENASEYLTSQGVNVANVISSGLKDIKRIQMRIEADRTRKEMQSAELVRQKAADWVDSLLKDIDFSLPQFIINEELTMSFRNVESLSQEDIKNILTKHFTLKFMQEHNSK